MTPILLLVFAIVASGDDADSVYRIGKNVTPPTIIRKVDPEYSQEARSEGVQGSALFSLIVDRTGKPRDIELLSPLGYGLDEKAAQAIEKWVFKPGEKDGMPVNIRATIEVNFSLGRNIPFDAKAERNRTAFNAAIHDFQTAPGKPKAIESIRKLADEKYPPAMALLGEWMLNGEEIPKDLPGGLDLLRKAVDKEDRTGLYALGIAYIKGLGVPLDAGKGLRLLRNASSHGSPDAQLYLGKRYALRDSTINADTKQARYYFRLCAARGIAQCQFELGSLLIPGQGTGDPVQAIAWLELAAAGSVKEAEPLAQALRAEMSPEEAQMAEKLKAQLVRH